ncbi:MAG: exopolysaccharide biosynthesis protein [Marinicaulis sp.]|nr:exopolysaccharide biosynthesis protein [Marinicaulis sp.]
MNADHRSPSGNAMRGAARILHDILDDLSQANASTTGERRGSDDMLGHEPEAKARLGDLIDRLDERAFGLMLLLLALPCSIPFIYILPQIVALPMLALAGQMAAGRHHPWLPAALHEREFSPAAFQKVVVRSEKYLGWIERFARPRLKAVTGNLGARIVGALLLIPAASILVPLPSTNTVPGIGVAVVSLGLIERDGLLVILGLVIGFVWVGLLLFLGFEASHIIKDWISSRL